MSAASQVSPALQVAVLAGAAVAAWSAGRGAGAEVDVASGRGSWRGTSRLGSWWAATLDDVGAAGDPARWARVAGAGAVLLVVVATAQAGPSGAVGAVAVAGVAALVARLGLAGRGARRADADLPDLLEHAGRGLRSGLDLPRALRGAGDAVGGRHGDALVEVVGRMEAGAGLGDALGPWTLTHPRPDVRVAVAAVAVAASAGGRPSRALDGVAATLRSRAAVAAEARALASQARASAAVLVALPLVVAIGGAAADAQVAAALLGTGWGRGCAAVALALDGAGAWWMQRVVTAGGR